MSEWWTYRLHSFLMFSPEVYWRTVERHNLAWWPGQVVGLAVGVLLLVLVRRKAPAATRTALVMMALAWGWVAWAFEWVRYAEIFLGARWVAGAYGAEGLMLAAAGVPHFVRLRTAAAVLDHFVHRQPTKTAHRPRSVASGALLLLVALFYPLLAPLTGHPWREAEVIGFMPEPTALASLGVLAAAPLGTALRALLAVVPVLSLLLGAATRWLLAQ